VDEEFAQNLMQQVHELRINPEVERRREAGRLPDDFAIRAAQVIPHARETHSRNRTDLEVCCEDLVPTEPLSDLEVCPAAG
jgi:hypothetical protein